MLIAGLTIVVVGLVLVNIYLGAEPRNEEVPTELVPSFQPAEPEATKAGTIRYAGQTETDLPENMTIFRSLPQTVSEEKAKEMAKVMGLTKEEPEVIESVNQDKFYLFTGPENALSVGGTPVGINWGSSYEPKKVRPDKQQAVTLAKTIIADLGLVPVGSKLVLSEENYMEYTPIRLLKVTPQSSRASLLELIYHLELNDWPLVSDRLFESNIRVIITADKKVYTLTSFIWPEKIAVDREITIKSLQQAIFEVEKGKGTIVDVSQPTNFEGFLEVNLAGQSVVLGRAGLGYYYQAGSDIITPIYMFIGQVPNRAQAAIYLPAVKQK